MLEDTVSRGKPALLVYPASKEKNRYVVLTDAGRDHLERLSS
jgi:hypothetical protein